MTSVILNRVGGDIVDLHVTQTGSEETTVILKDPLLRGDKTYKFAVTEWSIPLQNVDMFGFISATTTELFSIQRRTVRSPHAENSQQMQDFETAVLAGGVDFAAYTALIRAEEAQRSAATFADDATLGLAARVELFRTAIRNLFSVVPTTAFVPFSSYSLMRGRKFYDVNQFAKSLADFATVFSEKLLETGTNALHFGSSVLHNGDHDSTLIVTNEGNANAPTFGGEENVKLLKIGLSCDGNLMIIGHPFFWNNFTIRWSNLGAALLGIDTTKLTDRTLAVTGNVVNAAFTGGVGDLIIGGDNTATVVNLSPVSLFQSSECRIKCSVESHLPVQSGVEVRDETETNNREICSAFFLNDISVETNWDATGSLGKYSLQSKVFAGQFPLIHQNSRIQQWNTLLTPYNLQFFRFFLNVHFRYFDDLTGVWKILTKRANIDEKDYWSMKIRFISDE